MAVLFGVQLVEFPAPSQTVFPDVEFVIFILSYCCGQEFNFEKKNWRYFMETIAFSDLHVIMAGYRSHKRVGLQECWATVQYY
jgi:hypothetical protein